MDIIFCAFVGGFYGAISGTFCCPSPIGTVGGFFSGCWFGAVLGYNNKCTINDYIEAIPKLGKDYDVHTKWTYEYHNGQSYPSQRQVITYK